MLTRNHWELAEYLCDRHQAIGRFGFMFKLGNIMPDINLLTYIKGHTPDRRLLKMSRQLARMADSGRTSWLSAYRFGVAMHYLADSFTYAHNRCFMGSLPDHLAYEKKLMPCFRHGLETGISDDSCQADFAIYLQCRYAAYLSEERSIETDSSYIIETALNVSHVMSESWSNSSQVLDLIRQRGLIDLR